MLSCINPSSWIALIRKTRLYLTAGSEHTEAEGNVPLDAAASKPAGSHASGSAERPKEIAVFDFDGTTITGNSPVLLVRYLRKKGRVRPSVLARILVWGAAYTLHLPQNEAWVRSLVFSSFEGMSKTQADEEMYAFYNEWIVPRIRPKALAAMQEHIDAGREIWIVSATFDPIIVEARKDIPYAHHVATAMKVDANGDYTREVDGLPVEGAEKLRQIRAHANEVYGVGNWKLAYAYGDHYSDTPLLSAAEHPCAVTPDHTLKRLAEKEGWAILDW